jgi:hypothetical protein
MKARIALSTILILLLAGTGLALADDAPAPPTSTNDGIGTSPSSELAATPTTCGIWVDGSEEAADQRALAGEPPDVLVFTHRYTGCSDALMIAWQYWPAGASVRYAVPSWRAVQASAAAPLATPASLWRLPDQASLPRLTRAGMPWELIIGLLSPIITTVVAKLFHSAVKDSNRQAQILGYASTAFQVVEAAAAMDPRLRGVEKYNRFIQQIVNNLQAAKQPDLSASEMEQLKQLARDKAYLAKAPPPPLPLPLPAPFAG